MRCQIAAELATGHGGDLDVALKMIRAAAEAGCDAVKIQHYGKVNPYDPQAEWLKRSRLDVLTIRRLREEARARGVEFWATPFNAASLNTLLDIGVDRIKIASSEAHAEWWRGATVPLVVSWPWGLSEPIDSDQGMIHLTAIPLYPTPLECVYRAVRRTQGTVGWSDHTIGLHACQYAIAQGVQWIEAHLTLGEGQSRVTVWDKHPDDFRRLREFADACATMRTGVSQQYRERWTA